MLKNEKNGQLISVILPVFNGERYLEKTLNSILNTTYNNLEVILIDDGSEDFSEKIYTNIANKDKRLKIFRKSNEGIVSARNYGLEKALGDYICFCDQDDLVLPMMYDLMYNQIVTDKSDICMCSAGIFIGNKAEEKFKIEDNACFTREKIVKFFLEPILCHYQLENSKIKLRAIWSCMFKSELIYKNSIKFKRFIDYEDDWLFLIDALYYSNRISTRKDMLYLWRYNIYSTSHRKRYIECYLEKDEKLNEYLHEVSLKINMIPNMINKNRLYRINQLIMTMFNNEFSSLNPKKHRNRIIFLKDFLNIKDIQIFIYHKTEITLTKKAKILLFLLKYNLIFLAYFLGKINYELTTNNFIRIHITRKNLNLNVKRIMKTK